VFIVLFLELLRIARMFKEPRNRFQGIESANLCRLAGRYDNPIPTRFLAHIYFTEPEFLNFSWAQESIQRINSAILCSLVGRCDNPIPTGFQAP
jgi:hypothetical protein